MLSQLPNAPSGFFLNRAESSFVFIWSDFSSQTFLILSSAFSKMEIFNVMFPPSKKGARSVFGADSHPGNTAGLESDSKSPSVIFGPPPQS